MRIKKNNKAGKKGRKGERARKGERKRNTPGNSYAKMATVMLSRLWDGSCFGFPLCYCFIFQNFDNEVPLGNQEKKIQ